MLSPTRPVAHFNTSKHSVILSFSLPFLSFYRYFHYIILLYCVHDELPRPRSYVMQYTHITALYTLEILLQLRVGGDIAVKQCAHIILFYAYIYIIYRAMQRTVRRRYAVCYYTR